MTANFAFGTDKIKRFIIKTEIFMFPMNYFCNKKLFYDLIFYKYTNINFFSKLLLICN
jgi:hypothetical protein